MNVHTFEVDLDGKKLTIETGKIAKQAAGSVVVRMGDSVVLVSACAAARPKPNQSFFPLTCDDGSRPRVCELEHGEQRRWNKLLRRRYL